MAVTSILVRSQGLQGTLAGYPLGASQLESTSFLSSEAESFSRFLQLCKDAALTMDSKR